MTRLDAPAQEAELRGLREALADAIPKLCVWCQRGDPISDDRDGLDRKGAYHYVSLRNGHEKCGATMQRAALTLLDASCAKQHAQEAETQRIMRNAANAMEYMLQAVATHDPLRPKCERNLEALRALARSGQAVASGPTQAQVVAFGDAFRKSQRDRPMDDFYDHIKAGFRAAQAVRT